MIIKIIETALIECTTRTPAGSITFAGTVAVLASLAVMLDMAVPPEFAPDYTPESPSRYCDTTYQVDRSGVWRSQKSEPGCPGSPSAYPVGTRRDTRGVSVRTPASAQCRSRGSRRWTD